MESIKLLARNGQAVRHALELGEILHMETASEELTDEFLIFAIKSGLLKAWADGFPDTTRQCFRFVQAGHDDGESHLKLLACAQHRGYGVRQYQIGFKHFGYFHSESDVRLQES